MFWGGFLIFLFCYIIERMKILIINTGSESKKYAIYEGENKIYSAHFETENGGYVVTETFNLPDQSEQKEKKEITEKIFRKAQAYLLESLVNKKLVNSKEDIGAIGIRIVAPGEYFLQDRIIDKEYLKKAKQALKKVPLHLGPALAEIKVAKKVFAAKKIVGVSDSTFHKSLPAEAKYYAIPINDSRKLGLQKFGYHGISIKSVLFQTEKRLGHLPAKVIICHLGGGASVTAVKDGKSVETSMGFTPLDGLVMATRVGDIDPGAVVYLADKLWLSTRKLEEYFNNKCGLFGLSGKSSDVRDLLKYEKEGDQDSALALKIYANRLKKHIGSAAAVLGGIDLLIFAGTVGERSFVMRGRICEGLQFLGVNLDMIKNNETEGVEAEISSQESRVKVLVMKTDEMEQIAKETISVL